MLPRVRIVKSELGGSVARQTGRVPANPLGAVRTVNCRIRTITGAFNPPAPGNSHPDAAGKCAVGYYLARYVMRPVAVCLCHVSPRQVRLRLVINLLNFI